MNNMHDAPTRTVAHDITRRPQASVCDRLSSPRKTNSVGCIKCWAAKAFVPRQKVVLRLVKSLAGPARVGAVVE